MEENCPDVTVKVVIKHPDEWKEFQDSVSKHFDDKFKTVIKITNRSLVAGVPFLWILLLDYSIHLHLGRQVDWK